MVTRRFGLKPKRDKRRKIKKKYPDIEPSIIDKHNIANDTLAFIRTRIYHKNTTSSTRRINFPTVKFRKELDRYKLYGFNTPIKTHHLESNSNDDYPNLLSYMLINLYQWRGLNNVHHSYQSTYNLLCRIEKFILNEFITKRQSNFNTRDAFTDFGTPLQQIIMNGSHDALKLFLKITTTPPHPHPLDMSQLDINGCNLFHALASINGQYTPKFMLLLKHLNTIKDASIIPLATQKSYFKKDELEPYDMIYYSLKDQQNNNAKRYLRKLFHIYLLPSNHISLYGNDIYSRSQPTNKSEYNQNLRAIYRDNLKPLKEKAMKQYPNLNIPI